MEAGRIASAVAAAEWSLFGGLAVAVLLYLLVLAIRDRRSKEFQGHSFDIVVGSGGNNNHPLRGALNTRLRKRGSGTFVWSPIELRYWIIRLDIAVTDIEGVMPNASAWDDGVSASTALLLRYPAKEIVVTCTLTDYQRIVWSTGAITHEEPKIVLEQAWPKIADKIVRHISAYLRSAHPAAAPTTERIPQHA